MRNPGFLATKERAAKAAIITAIPLGGIGLAHMIWGAMEAGDAIQNGAYQAAAEMTVHNPEFVTGGVVGAIGAIAGGAYLLLRRSIQNYRNSQ